MSIETIKKKRMAGFFMVSMSFLLAATVMSCGVGKKGADQSSVSIANGDVVMSSDLAAASTVALVQPLNFGSGEIRPYCSGTLIEKDLVVTAGHCISDTRVLVSFGLGLVDEPVVALGTAMAHERFDTIPNGIFLYDIAVIRLDRGAPDFMVPVPIAQTGDFQVGDEVLLAGYGLVIPKGRTRPVVNGGVLYQVSTKIAEILETPTRVPGFSQPLFGLIAFASDDGLSGGCQGDSGGPMYIQREGNLQVIGSTVGGPGVCAAKGYYSNLRQYAPWIQQAAMKLPSSLGTERIN